MPKVVRKDVDNLNIVLTVNLEPKDYEPKFLSELNKYRKEASLKGFRKGKTPLSVLKKMFGKKVLLDVVNETLNTAVFDYLKEEKVEYLGQPIPVEGHEDQDFDPKNLGEYTFEFDLGLEPAFEVEGLGDTYEKLEVELTDALADEEIEKAQKSLGAHESAEDEIQEKDKLILVAEELEDGKLKEGGIENEFTVLVENLVEDAKKQVLGKKAGVEFNADLFAFEKDFDEKQVRRYFLGLEDDDEKEVGKAYQLTINEVQRYKEAELDQEFFDKFFGPESISSVEEAREKILEGYADFYKNQGEALLFRDIQKRLMEKNNQELPEAFLKRWLGFADEKADEALIEKDFPNFAENLKWTLIRTKMSKKYDIQVSEEEIKGEMIKKAQSMINMYGGQLPGMDMGDLYNRLVENMMQDEKEVKNASTQIIDNKVFESLAKEMTLEPKKVTREEMDEIMAKAKEEAEAVRNAGAEEEE